MRMFSLCIFTVLSILFEIILGSILLEPIMAAIPRVVFVLGAPGSGKGTQCSRLFQRFSYLHLSAGDLLRAERSKETSPFRDEIERHMREGTIVPVEITVNLLWQAMQQSPSKLVLIDGFPRNQDNLDGWQRVMKDRANVDLVLLLECPVDTCIQRCLSRGQGRIDDNEETLRKRINTFNKDTSAIINHYDKLGLVRRVDASQQPDDVFAAISKLVENSV